MRSARPSGKPTNRSGRPSTKLGLLGMRGGGHVLAKAPMVRDVRELLRGLYGLDVGCMG
ncbi:MAG: hypothetical protein LM600_04790 [Thaumarchaeota archaeon]|nr:hypothetical protein [Nitrososphaerota archaeon]